MLPFLITARTATACLSFSVIAASSAAAALVAADALGDQPYGITVIAGVR